MTELPNYSAIPEGVVAWAREQIPALKEGYPYPVGATTGALPDVVVAMQAPRIVRGPSEAFPQLAIEQADRVEFDLELSIMVEQEGEGAAAEKTAHQELEAFAQALQGSTLADPTLGGRVPVTSPFTEADLSAPFEERPNGDRGRAMFLAMTVAAPVEIEP